MNKRTEQKKHSDNRGHGHTHKKSKHKDAVAELTGMIRINARGFGFVSVPEREEDIEVAPEMLNTAFHLDTVRIVTLPKRHNHRIRGEVLEVLERSKTRWVGVLEQEAGFTFFKPDDHRVYIDFILERGEGKDVPVGQKVVVELMRWSSPKKNPLARVVEILGPEGEHETEMRSIVAEQGFDWSLPKDVEEEAKRIDANKDSFFA
jgi:ribonuclease R